MALHRKGKEEKSAISYATQRKKMVEKQIVKRGVKDPLVLAAMISVPRHEFVSPDQLDNAYEDRPLPIGENQTISQPYIVALMTELLELKGAERVLEVGTGSGYQAAVLAEIVQDVYTVEILKPLMEKAQDIFRRLCYRNVHVKCGDAYEGWPDEAPFDAVVVTAAPWHIPPLLLRQLVEGGRMVIPKGKYHQDLVTVRKTDGIEEKRVIPVRFVPMTGQIEEEEENEVER